MEAFMSLSRFVLFASLAIALGGCTIRTRGGGGAYAPPPPPPAYPAAQPGYAAPQPAPGAQPQAGGQFLGAREVSFRADHDVIHVGAADGRFRRIRLHVSGAPLEMHNVRVVFGDGSMYSPPTRLHFAQGSWSRDIDLPGDARVIRRVEFWYDTRGVRHGRAQVQLFGV
jgi:hypothetical protein